VSSEEYIYHCLDILKADKVSEQTMILMFLEYGKILLKEKNNGK